MDQREYNYRLRAIKMRLFNRAVRPVDDGIVLQTQLFDMWLPQYMASHIKFNPRHLPVIRHAWEHPQSVGERLGIACHLLDLRRMWFRLRWHQHMEGRRGNNS